MTVLITKPAGRLYEKMYELIKQPSYNQVQFWFVADGSLVDFTLPTGWKPLHVYNAGLLGKEGSGDEYTVVDNAVTFAVAPTNLNDVCIVGVLA